MFDIDNNINTYSALPTRDLDAAIARYIRLGFTTTRLATQTGIPCAAAERDGIELLLAEDDSRNDSNWIVTLVAADAELLFQEWKVADVDGLLLDNATFGSAEVAGGYIDPDGILFIFATE